MQDVLKKTNKFFVNGKGCERAFVVSYIKINILRGDFIENQVQVLRLRLWQKGDSVN